MSSETHHEMKTTDQNPPPADQSLYSAREPPHALGRGRWRVAKSAVFPGAPGRRAISVSWAAVFLSIMAVYGAAATLYIVRRGRTSGETSRRTVSPPDVLSPDALSFNVAEPGSGDGDETVVRRLQTSVARRMSVLREADRLADRGLLDKAIERIEEELRRDNSSLALRLRRADFMLMAESVEASRDAYLDVLRADPFLLPAREGLAKALWAAKDHAAALAAARWVLEVDGRRLAALRIAAQAAIETGDHELAVGHLRTWAQLDPTSVSARDFLGLAYLRLGDYGKAGFQLGDLIRKGQGTEATFLNLALAYAKQRQPSSVAGMLMKASERFSRERVLQWVERPDFADIAADPVVASVVSQIRMGVRPATALAMPGERGEIAFEQGIGLTPAPDLGIRPASLQ